MFHKGGTKHSFLSHEGLGRKEFVVTLYFWHSLTTADSHLICQQAVMGLVYFVFVSLNTDELSTRSKITTSNEEETLEEARRIMEKYK